MRKEELTEIELLIEERLSESAPGVELLAVDSPGSERLRIFIDSDAGVDLDLCEAVTGLLPDLLADYALEVSSPGPERPLARPQHFAAAVGERIVVRTEEPLGGRRNFTGTLLRADAESLEMQVEGGEVTIPLASVERANVHQGPVPEASTENEREVRA